MTEPGQPPPALPRDLALHVRQCADRLARYPFAVWHYGDSIGAEGLLAATTLLADSRYEAFVYGLSKGWAPRRHPFAELDNTAPGHVICDLSVRMNDDGLRAAALELGHHLRTRRLVRGCFESFARSPLRKPHAGSLTQSDRSLLRDPGPGVFLDCLHFDAPFFAHLSRLQQSREYCDLAYAQACAMIDLLQDSSGLFFHFYLEEADERFILGWSRGQGWALLGLLDVLELAPTHPDRPKLIQAVTRLAAALATSQLPNGHWPRLIDEHEADDETSAALFFASGFARAVRMRLLPPEYKKIARRAWRAGASRVGDGGEVHRVTEAVWASTVVDHYRAVPLISEAPWAQGAFLVAALECVNDDTCAP